MGELISVAVVGIFLITLGIINTTGDLRSLHWYHRQRITPENKKPFGRLVGWGSIIIGAAILIFGGLSFAYQKTQLFPLIVIGAVAIVVSVVIGLGLIFYAMIKYNKGIF